MLDQLDHEDSEMNKKSCMKAWAVDKGNDVVSFQLIDNHLVSFDLTIHLYTKMFAGLFDPK